VRFARLFACEWRGRGLVLAFCTGVGPGWFGMVGGPGRCTVRIPVVRTKLYTTLKAVLSWGVLVAVWGVLVAVPYVAARGHVVPHAPRE
jgi:hypothetical protein